MRWLDDLREVERLTHISGIARRYFVMNAFDGVVTVLGVVAGTWGAGVEEPRIVLLTGLGASLAMAVSGVSGAWLSETAERDRTLGELEHQLLTDLSDTRLARAARVAVWLVTLVDGASPLLAGALPLAPFAVGDLLPDLRSAYVASGVLAGLELVALGVYLGRIGRGGGPRYVLFTLTAGVLALAGGLSMRACEP
ncbi:MAG: VIT1/CCC1 transporter family protein [Alphaproteobacteria bacterium]|nr:VIT1/CCC1 transporter family protein [Alphaproteobacteria bacterium]